MDGDELYDTVVVRQRCRECGAAVTDYDKNTFSGRDIRWYRCEACPWSDFIDAGIALWAAMSEAKKDRQ
jgi:hypothetical protein